MGTRVKFAKWYRDGKLFRVQPPDWPKMCELSFTNQRDMLEWAQAEHVMLKDGNVSGRAYDRRAVGSHY